MARKRTNWTEYETARAREYIAADMRPAIFLQKTGRSIQTARAHIKYIDDPAYRQRCVDSTMRYRKTYERRVPSDLPTLYGRTEPAPAIPPSVIDEAKRRLAAPKTLTGWICGDPPIGFRALDRRPPTTSAEMTS